jgi:putative endonuclease
MSWFVYLIECQDGSLYTGVAVDVEARYRLHSSGKGARYTRSRPPQRLLASLAVTDRSSALREEYRIKQLSVSQKRAFCEATGLQHLAGTANTSSKTTGAAAGSVTIEVR